MTATYEMVFERTGVDICSACLVAAANGLHPDDSELPTMPLSRVPDGYHVVPGAYTIGGDEAWFSTTACDTCGDTLHGHRHQATLMTVERVPCIRCIELVRHTH